MLTLPPPDSRSMQLEDLRKSELIYINEKSVCDKNDDNIPEKIIAIKNFALKELSEIFQDIKCTKSRILEASPLVFENLVCSKYVKDNKYIVFSKI